jgi:hypothetical protein
VAQAFVNTLSRDLVTFPSNLCIFLFTWLLFCSLSKPKAFTSRAKDTIFPYRYFARLAFAIGKSPWKASHNGSLLARVATKLSWLKYRMVQNIFPYVVDIKSNKATHLRIIDAIKTPRPLNLLKCVREAITSNINIEITIWKRGSKSLHIIYSICHTKGVARVWPLLLMQA